jgi:hypothetical protein
MSRLGINVNVTGNLNVTDLLNAGVATLATASKI